MQNQRFLGHVDRLFAYAVSLTRDHDQARDALQECAVRALAAARVPEDAAAYRAWLFRIMRNAFIDRQRKAGAAIVLASDGEAGDVADDWDIEDHLVDAITVKQGLALLSQNHREIIALVDIAGLSYSEAAEVFDIPIGTVMSRLTRARRALLGNIRDSNVRPFRAPHRNHAR